MTIYEDINMLANLGILEIKKDTKILVVGGTGFIGSYIIKVLLEYNKKNINKYYITIPVRKENHIKDIYNLDSDNSEYINCIKMDICSCYEIEAEFEYIIHSAAITSPCKFRTNPVETYMVNTLSVYYCLEFARKCKLESMVFVSTASVYGKLFSECFSEEEIGQIDYTDSNNVYAISKRESEFLCKAYHKQYGVPVKIVRPFQVYGPGMDLSDNTLFGNLIIQARKNKEIRLNSSGKQKRNFCYISDTVRAILYVLLIGDSGEFYNIGNEKSSESIYDLSKMILKIEGINCDNIFINETSVVLESNKSNTECMIPNLSKINLLGDYGEQEKISLFEGLSTMLKNDFR